MISFIIRRLLWMIPVLLFITFITFALMHMAPGGPWDTDPSRRQLSAAQVKAMNARFGLDKPVFFNTEGTPSKPWTYLDSQFFNYIWNIVTKFDFGPSYRQRGRDVSEIIMAGLPTSFKLGFIAFVWATVVGIGLGLWAALRQNTMGDYTALFLATVLRSIPSFVLGIFLIVIFVGWLHWMNIIQDDWSGIQPYIMPAIVLGAPVMAFIARLTRSSMLDVTRQDYIRTARAKGLSERTVVMGHMLKNAMIPVVTVLGPSFVLLVTGSFIIETLFGMPGIGQLFVTSINSRDYSLIMATTLFYAFLVAIANMLVDITYAFIDPRIRLS
ncbi:MAG: ABC transporter permease [Anaerolineae bacterium]